MVTTFEIHVKVLLFRLYNFLSTYIFGNSAMSLWDYLLKLLFPLSIRSVKTKLNVYTSWLDFIFGILVKRGRWFGVGCANTMPFSNLCNWHYFHDFPNKCSSEVHPSKWRLIDLAWPVLKFVQMIFCLMLLNSFFSTQNINMEKFSLKSQVFLWFWPNKLVFSKFLKKKLALYRDFTKFF